MKINSYLTRYQWICPMICNVLSPKNIRSQPIRESESRSNSLWAEVEAICESNELRDIWSDDKRNNSWDANWDLLYCQSKHCIQLWRLFSVTVRTNLKGLSVGRGASEDRSSPDSSSGDAQLSPVVPALASLWPVVGLLCIPSVTQDLKRIHRFNSSACYTSQTCGRSTAQTSQTSDESMYN